VGLSAEETASALELSLQATNSALFRARSAVESKRQGKARSAAAAHGAPLSWVVARYLAAWNQIDVEAFIGLLHDEVKTTMPPSPTWLAGRRDHELFYRPMFAAQRPGTFIALPTGGANGQPAFAFYRALAAGEPHRLRAIQLVEVRDDAIASIDHFMLPELGPAFGLPPELDRHAADSAVAAPCHEVAAEALRSLKR
jgi:RNA polymerase sigma-70 factor (ECF subfamily)